VPIQPVVEPHLEFPADFANLNADRVPGPAVEQPVKSGLPQSVTAYLERNFFAAASAPRCVMNSLAHVVCPLNQRAGIVSLASLVV
jgi:hypothetical protein